MQDRPEKPFDPPEKTPIPKAEPPERPQDKAMPERPEPAHAEPNQAEAHTHGHAKEGGKLETAQKVAEAGESAMKHIGEAAGKVRSAGSALGRAASALHVGDAATKIGHATGKLMAGFEKLAALAESERGKMLEHGLGHAVRGLEGLRGYREAKERGSGTFAACVDGVFQAVLSSNGPLGGLEAPIAGAQMALDKGLPRAGNLFRVVSDNSPLNMARSFISLGVDMADAAVHSRLAHVGDNLVTGKYGALGGYAPI